MQWQTLGFEPTKNFFKNAISNGQLSHAYLFTGQEMIGKRTFALELAEMINGRKESFFAEASKDKQMTGAMGDQMSLDVLVVSVDNSENKGSIAIEDIRKAKSFLSLSPNVGPYKFVIIDNADQMTTEAQNAFLKVLEEASESSIIILVTAFKDVLLPTIISRCQEIQFANHPAEEIKRTLIKEMSLEKSSSAPPSSKTSEGQSKASADKAEFLSKFVNGRLGLALKIAREDLFDKLKSDIEEFAKIKKESLSSRLKLAQLLADEEKMPELKEKILYWMLYLHMQSRSDLDQSKFQGSTLKNLIDLNYHLNQPQFNRRLIVEDFMVRL